MRGYNKYEDIVKEEEMVEKDKISVIVPLFNAETFLNRCVDSIINQTYENLEIILVDDGSTDNSPNICDEYKLKDARVKVVHQKNSGVSYARNTGIKCATGKWILWVDSDDYIDPKLCEKVYSTAIKYCADIVVFGFLKFYDDGKVEKVNGEEESRLIDISEAMRQLSDKKIGNFPWNRFYKKELFDGIKYPNGRVFEDIGTTYRLIDKANTMYFLDSNLYYYYQANNSITHTISQKNITDEFEQRYEQYNYLLKQKYDAVKLVKEELLADALQYCIYSPYEPENQTYKNASVVIKQSKGMKLIFGGTYRIMYWIYRVSIPIFNLICILCKKRL